MASDFLKRKAQEQAQKIDEEYGASAYGGTEDSAKPTRASGFLARKAQEQATSGVNRGTPVVYNSPLMDLAQETTEGKTKTQTPPFSDGWDYVGQQQRERGEQTAAAISKILTPQENSEQTGERATFWDALKALYSPKNFLNNLGTGLQTTARVQAEMATDDVIDPIEAAGIGTFRAMGALPLGEAASHAAAAISGDDQIKANAQNVSDVLAKTYQEAQTQQPAAYKAGNIFGSIMLTRGINAGINAALGPLGAAGEGAQVLNVPLRDKLIRSGITGGTAFAGRWLLQNAGDVASGRMSAGDYAKEALASGVGGAVGGVASTAVGEVGHGVLSGLKQLSGPDTINPATMLPGNGNSALPTLLRFGLEHNELAHQIVAATAGAVYSGANLAGRQATRAVTGLPQENMTGADVASEILIGGAFGYLGYIAANAGNTTVEKAAERGVKAYQEAEYAAANDDPQGFESAVNDLQNVAEVVSTAAAQDAQVAQAAEIINNVVAGMAAQDIVSAAGSAPTPSAPVPVEPETPEVPEAKNTDLPQYQPIPQEPVNETLMQLAQETAAAQTDDRQPFTPTQMVRMMASEDGIGENGAQIAETIASAHRDAQDVTNLYGGIRAIYSAGLNGETLDSVTIPAVQQLTPAERMEAFNAGKQDAIAAQANQRAGTAQQNAPYTYDVERSGDHYTVRVTSTDGSVQTIGEYATQEEAQDVADFYAQEYNTTAKEAGQNGIEGAEGVRGRSAGDLAQRAGQQTGAVPEGAAGAGGQRGAAAPARSARQRSGEKVSRRVVQAQSLISNAAPNQTVTVLDGPETESQRNIDKLAQQNGIKGVTLFEGGQLAYTAENGEIGHARAYHNPDGTIGVQTDNAEVADYDLALHEVAEHLIDTGKLNADEALEAAAKYVAPEKIDAAVRFYADCLTPRGETTSAKIIEHAKNELVCDSGDHINQLRYDVDHGVLTSTEMRNFADLLDEVLDGINRANNELTDNAFVLNDGNEISEQTAGSGATRFSEKLMGGDENGRRYNQENDEGRVRGGVLVNNALDAESTAQAGGQGNSGRGVRGASQKGRGRSVRYEELTQTEKDFSHTLLFDPVDNGPEWYRSYYKGYTVTDLDEHLYAIFSENTQEFQNLCKLLPEFKAGADKLLAYLNGEEAAPGKIQKTDNTGLTLSEGQYQYFQNSKQKDAQGHLMVMYRGGKEDISVFDRKKSSYTNLYGRGFYYTDSVEHAREFGEPIAYYLNIETPLMPGQHMFTKAQMRAFLKAVAQDDDYGLENYGYGATVESVLRGMWGKGDFEMLQDVNATAIGDLVAAAELFNTVNGTKYDGFILPTESVTFSSEQAKKITNLNPTSNPNVNFSKKLTDDTLRRENDALRERVEYWKGQTRRTTEITARAEDAKKAARDLVKSYDSTVDAAEIAPELKSLTEFVMRGGDDFTWSGLKERAQAIAREIVNNAEVLRSADDGAFDEVRALLKRPMKISPQDAHDVTPDGWGAWRNSVRDRVNVSINGDGTPVDTVYQQLSEMMPGMFPEDITHPADQLLHMVEVMNDLAPVYENPYSYNMAEAVEYCANDIIDRVLGEDIRQTPPTFADKAAAKLAAEKARGAERTRRALERVRAQRDAKIAALKERYAEKQQAARDRRADSAARTKLLKIAKRLMNKKLPAVSRAWLNEKIGDLDTVAKSITGKGVENLVALRDWYEEQKASNPDFIADAATEAKIARLAKTQISDLTPTQVQELTEVLLNFEHEINSQRQLLESEDKRDTRQMVLESMYNVEEAKGSKKTLADWLATNTLSPVRLVKRLVGYNADDPLLARTKELADGQRRMMDYQMRAERLFSKWTNDKKLMDRLRSRERVKITGYKNGNAVEVEITPDMRMALYLHSLNDENMKHIANGGVTIPNIDLYLKGELAEAYARGITVKLTPSNVRSIAAGMSAEERAYARAAHDYFNGMSRDEINAVSEALVGYSIANVDDYFPIETDRNFTKSDIAELKRDGTIEGMGFLKERVHASNAINLVPLTDVLNRSIKNHAKYVGLAIPIRNMSNIWGMNAHNDMASEDSGLRQAIGHKWGERGVDAVEQMITDLQNSYHRADEAEKLLAKIRSNYAGAVLTLNASVALKQAASYPTAAAVLGWGPLVKALGNFGRVDLDLINKYTPLQWYRSQGYSTQELGDIRGQKGFMDKVLGASVRIGGRDVPILNWIQGIDLATTRKLWKASEYYVRQQSPDLSVGSDAYYRAVADIYNRVIEETQPNYTTMQRPQLLRSNNQLLQSLVMFKTQPFQNFGILYDALGELSAAERAAKNGDDSKLKQAKKNAANAVTSNLVSAAVFAAMTMAWALARRKKDKYEDKDGNFSPWAQLGKDVLSSEFGMIPFGSDAYNLLASWIFDEKYYGMTNITSDSVSGALDSMKTAFDTLGSAVSAMLDGDDATSADPEKIARQLFNAAKDVSKLAGIPLENVVNLVTAVYSNVASAVNGEYVTAYNVLRLTKNMDSSASKSAAYDLLYKASRHNNRQFQELKRMMIEDGFKEKNIDAAMKKRAEK